MNQVESLPSLTRCAGRHSGFTLVEALVALALGVWLISAVAVTTQQLWRMARVSADRSDMAARGDYAVRLLTSDARRAWPVWYQEMTQPPCEDPVAGVTRGVRVVPPGLFSCLPDRDLVAGAPLLIIESLQACSDVYCAGQPLPGWRFEQPGCDPLFMDVGYRIRHHDTRLKDGDCAGFTQLSVWTRRVYYLRNYTVHPGDGTHALMMKSWRGPGEGFGRGEVLVAGVDLWELGSFKIPAERDELSVYDPNSYGSMDWTGTPGFDFRLGVEGWLGDALVSAVVTQATTAAGNPNWTSPEGMPTLVFAGRAVSAYLMVDPSIQVAD